MAERKPFYRFQVMRYFVRDDEVEYFGDYDSVRVPRVGATITLRWMDTWGENPWGEPAARVRVVARLENLLHVVPPASSRAFIRHVQRKAVLGKRLP